MDWSPGEVFQSSSSPFVLLFVVSCQFLLSEGFGLETLIGQNVKL